MQIVKKSAFGILVAALFAPLAQQVFNLAQPQLKGVYTVTDKPACSAQAWFDGTWQQQFSDYCETHVGYRPWFIQLKNHIEYHAFHNVPGGMVIGKNGFLFDQAYINTYLGKDRKPVDTLLNQTQKLAYIEQYLAKRNKHICVVMAPNKARFHAEFLPQHVQHEQHTITNYDLYRVLFRANQIPHVDMAHYFSTVKDTATRLWYTKQGVHWSVYSTSFVTDSIVHYLQHLAHRNWGHYEKGPEQSRNTPYDSDDDLMQTINTLGSPSGETFSYIPVTFKPEGTLPRVLIIGDSYVWALLNHGAWLQSMAPGSQYLYYNHDVYTLTEKKELVLEGTKEKTAVPHHITDVDFIVLVNTEPNLEQLGGGFIDAYYHQLISTQQPAK